MDSFETAAAAAAANNKKKKKNVPATPQQQQQKQQLERLVYINREEEAVPTLKEMHEIKVVAFSTVSRNFSRKIAHFFFLKEKKPRILPFILVRRERMSDFNFDIFFFSYRPMWSSAFSVTI